MSQQIDPQALSTEDLEANEVIEMARFDALITKVRELRERADELSAEAQSIIAQNRAVRAMLERQR